jgi:hypothetical protein
VVHREGVAHWSSASHGDSSRSGEGCLRQVGTVAVAVGSPVGEECGSRAKLEELLLDLTRAGGDYPQRAPHRG